MSRIGKAPISVPAGVELKIDNNLVHVKGPKGELSQKINADLILKLEDGVLTVERPSDQKEHRAMHGLYRSLINNMIVGVTEGFKKQLELVGVGYRAKAQGQQLELSLGFSHPIILSLPPEISVSAEQEKGKNPIVTLESYDKQLIGMIASKIRSFRKPEPYKGKGVKFVGEYIRRKAGKAAAK